jgi:hypothetical protein
MLDSSKFIQYYIGAEFRVEQAHGGSVAKSFVGMVHPYQKLVFAAKYFRALGGNLGNLQDLLGYHAIKGLPGSVSLYGSLSYGKKLSYFTDRAGEIFSQMRQSIFRNPTIAQINQVHASFDVLPEDLLASQNFGNSG